MALLKDLYNNLKKINVKELAVQSINDTSDVAANLNTSQMFSGLTSDRDNIKPAYTKKTVSIKASKGQPTDRVTLRDKGDFYEGIFVKAEGEKIIFSSTDEKTGDLEFKYSKKIFGLTDESKSIYVKEILFDNFVNRIKKILKL